MEGIGNGNKWNYAGIPDKKRTFGVQQIVI